MADLYKSPRWLRKRYLIDKKTAEEIAKECSVQPMTIYRHLQAAGLIKKR